MEKELKQFFLDLIKKEAVPALGCTEPIAVALSVAKAKELLQTVPDRIDIYVSGNIFKNAMSVGIPGTGQVGLPIAAALGAICGDAEAELQVLHRVNQNAVKEAQQLLKDNRVSIQVKEQVDNLYVESICQQGENTAKIIISQQHTLITHSELNHKVLYQRAANPQEELNDNRETSVDPRLTVCNIYDFATTCNSKELEFVLEGVTMNQKISAEGLQGNYGLQVGKKLLKNIDHNLLQDGLITDAVARTAAASDARMDGCTLPVMSNTGSGNQGIVAILPVASVANKLQKSKEELVRALALSLLIPIHIKKQMGALSALCGVVVAATGSGCGITYLLGGKYHNIEYAIKNMAGNIVGMICDGAKPGCSLKVATGVSSAVTAALLSIDDIVVPKDDGIIDGDIEKTIRNIAILGSRGMDETDKMIVDMMICK